MKKRISVVFLGSLLVLALLVPAAFAAGHDPYTAYGSTLRQTYGASLGQINTHAPGSLGARIGQYPTITSKSYGVRLGQYRVLHTETYGSKLKNRSGNVSVIPYIAATAEPTHVAF